MTDGSEKILSNNTNHATQALHFTTKNPATLFSEQKECHLSCLFCQLTFVYSNEKEDFLRHLLLEHKFVIGDVKLVANFPRYVHYWRDRFKDNPKEEFCSVIKTNSSRADSEPSEFYHLLCDFLPEDKNLRELLQKERLDSVLEQNKEEREDNSFSRMCLFCRKQFVGNRKHLFKHMAEDHSFSVGQPNNLVYGSELLDILEEKLKNLQCLYCEKVFKTWEVLKEHMRKKQHKKINPKNSSYDKFYLINYLELGKNWEALEFEDDRCLLDNDGTEEWNDWQEEEGLGAVCLFCDFTSTDFEDLTSHMKDSHSFNLAEIKLKMNLNFYQQVKLINFIRREVVQNRCYSCQKKFDNSENLRLHMKESQHTTHLPDSSEWDQPQFYFSTYENDNLLCIIEDESEENTAGVNVVPEDIKLQPEHSVLCNEMTRLSLVSEDI